MKRRVALLSAPVLAAALVAAACTSEPGPYHPSVPPEAASPAAAPNGDMGRVLYLRDCAWCHGGSAEGTPRAPDLRQAPRGSADVDFVLRTRRMPLRKPEDPMRRGAATTAGAHRKTSQASRMADILSHFAGEQVCRHHSCGSEKICPLWRTANSTSLRRPESSRPCEMDFCSSYTSSHRMTQPIASSYFSSVPDAQRSS